ncbi:interleukin-15 receptor subunit alpha isoform X2 [Pseudorasbora parva]|uniref:interleukin-15 receptor subunit alpha isoform X2 n=1 Tax=Pseudorasbora parva TaxID=51549 RepID=UPI00351E206E
MHMLGILIFMTAAYQHNLARGSGFCEPPTQAPNTVPVNEKHPVNATVRIKCAEGFVRKAGTSSLIRCKQKNGILSWHNDLPLRCIRDPKKQHKSQTPTQHFTSSTTERTEIKNTTILGTSMPTTATGHIIDILTTTNEVFTTKTRRTTSQPTLMSTTKEAEPFTTTNEITSTNSPSSSFKSRAYMTTTSSHTPSSPLTTITGEAVH